MSREYVLEPFKKPVNLQIDYQGELNEQQYAAVTASPKPALVIAGAGSGKTRTLTYRVAYLLEHGIPAERILLLTFTNKAAREMMRRVGDLLGSDISSLWGGTFHSIGNRILRKHAPQIGYKSDFTILDREDSKDLIKACMDEAKIETTEVRFPKAEVVGDIISMGLNTQKSIKETLSEFYPYFDTWEKQLEEIRELFQKRKQASNVMDFDDLLALWLKLLREVPDVQDLYQRRFQFVMVDEYQDTNKLQSEIIDLVAERHKNVMVVGDDSQSIYSWRGANFQNILEFPKRYEGAGVYKIETNYRSTPEILAVANAAIAPNIHQFEKQLVSSRKPGIKPILVPCGDGAEQAAFIGQRALELRDEGINLNEIAILYRSHFHALELQLELTRRNIPFSITSGIRFFEQAHIKDVAAYLKFVHNPLDEISFKRMVKLLPGVGGKSADKLWNCWKNKVAEAAASAEEVGLAAVLQRCTCLVPKKAAVAWAQFLATIAQLGQPQVVGKPADMIRLVLEAGYEDYIKESYTNFRARLEDLEQLATFAQQFTSTEDLLTQLALLSNVEAEDHAPPKEDDEQIRLSTIHQAKGLEFRVVFVIMLCDGMFPSSRALEKSESAEEERRLFYVAITRAKDELYLSYPLIRMTQGYSGDMMQQPSRFLADIPKALLDEWSLRSPGLYGGF
jgi:DNA helicase-2/ATP-dependent DNA helicase PcrA